MFVTDSNSNEVFESQTLRMMDKRTKEKKEEEEENERQLMQSIVNGAMEQDETNDSPRW